MSKKRKNNKNNKSKNNKNNKLKDKKIQITISIVILIIVLLLFFSIFISEDIISDIGNKKSSNTISEITSLELASNLDNYNGKNIRVLNAFVPSEAFIYVNENGINERITIKPPNKNYCRNFNFEGKLEKDSTDKWILNIDKSECLD